MTTISLPLELILFTFCLSLGCCLFFFFLNQRYGFGTDSKSGVQKLHLQNTARTGGIALVTAFIFAIVLYFSDAGDERLAKFILISIFPVVGSGFVEDITGKVQPFIRLFLSFSSAALFYFLLQVVIQRSGIDFFDQILDIDTYAFILTMLAIAAVLNGTNLIDGLNGLLAFYTMIVLFLLAILLYQFDDHFYFMISLFCLSAILGFVFFVFPFGKLFLGDGGAYFLGIMLSFLVITTINNHPIVSPWFALLLIIYPFFELQVSILRRLIKKQSPLRTRFKTPAQLALQLAESKISFKANTG